MPVVPLQCPLCAGLIQIDVSLAGQQVGCPLCQGAIALPPPEFFVAMLGPEAAAGPPPGELLPLVCPVCGGPFQVSAAFAGQQVGCPHCTSPIAIPPLDVMLPPGASFADAPPILSRPRESTPAARGSDRLPPPMRAPRPAIDDRPPPAPLPPGPLPDPVFEPISIDALLPPGAAADIRPPLAAQDAPAARQPKFVDSLLPPGAVEPSATSPGERVAIPAAPKRTPLRPKNLPAGSVAVPTSDGGFTTIVDSPRTIRDGDEEIEVRRLAPEEKSRRRFQRNLVLWAVCLVILVLVFMLMR